MPVKPHSVTCRRGTPVAPEGYEFCDRLVAEYVTWGAYNIWCVIENRGREATNPGAFCIRAIPEKRVKCCI